MKISTLIFTRKLNRFYLLPLILMAIPFLTSAQDLFTDDDLNYIAVPQVRNAISQRTIKINNNIFIKLNESEKNIPKTFTIDLFNGEKIEAKLDNVASASKDTISWIGHIKGNPNDQVILTINKKSSIVMGTIHKDQQNYKVEYFGQARDQNGKNQSIHVLKLLDPSKHPKDHPSNFPNGVILKQINHSIDTQSDSPQADDGTVIDIMVVYTPSTKNAVGGTAAINTLIDLAITETNASYSASGINPTVNLVHKQEVTFTETTFNDALDKLRLTSDGVMDNVHTLRDTYHADLVSLLINDSSSCGLGYLNSSASTAFTVVHHGCATGYYSFAHEFGHNQGARHDWRVDQTDSHNHGYLNASKSWRTIMAYNDTTNCAGGYCTRKNFWSNPDKLYNGDPTGVPIGSYHPADNRKTLNDSALTVANFRSSNPPAGDNFEPDNTSSTASPILNGVLQNHSLHVGSDIDWVTFTLSAATTDIVLETNGPSDSDTLIDLYDSNLTLIITNDDGGSGTYSKISQGLTAGVYYAKVREYGGNDAIGDYQLLLTYPGPFITSPVTGSTFSDSTEIFTLNNNGITLTNWNLKVGTSIGNNDISDRFAAGSATSLSVSNLPTDSSTIFVRLQYKENGTWKVAGDYTYTASAPISLPLITSPISNSTLSGSTEIFSLNNNGVTLTNWYLRLGTTIGGNDIANRFAGSSSNSITVNGLPTDNSTIYARLQYKKSGVWKLAGDYTYTASSPVMLPLITSPISGSTLTGSTEIFALNNNGIALTNWYLRLGTTVGGNEIANRFAGSSSNSITVNSLPTDNSIIYARLQFKEGGVWKLAGDYTYTASSPVMLPLITSPLSGSTLSGSTEIFTLDNNNITLTNWYLRVGTSIGANDIANRFAGGSSSSISITDLPTDSSTIYVRLQYKEGGVWKLAGDYSYTTSN